MQGRTVDFVPFAMFLGVSMCGTAFPVLARILAERNMFRIPLGLLLIACAAIDDIVAFTLLAFAAAMANGGGPGEVFLMVGKLAVFAVVLFVVVRPILEKLVVGPYRRTGKLSLEHLGILFIGLLLSSFITTKIGVHELIGAFLYGAAVPRRGAGNLFHDVAHRVEGVSLQLLLPVFFVVAGQGVNINGLQASDILPIIADPARRLRGQDRRRGHRRPRHRGAQTPVAGRRGDDEHPRTDGVGDPRRRPRCERDQRPRVHDARDHGGDHHRDGRTTAQLGVPATLAGPRHRRGRARRTNAAKDRIAVVVDDADTARPGVELAAAYGGGRDTGAVTLLRLTAGQGNLAAFADDLGELDALRAIAAETGVGVQVISRASADPAADTVAEIERVGAAAVVLPTSMLDLAPAIRRAGADVLVAGGASVDAAGVFVDGSRSGGDEQAALEIGARLALYHRVPLHVRGGVGRRARRQLDRLGVDVRDDDSGARISTDPAEPTRRRRGHGRARRTRPATAPREPRRLARRRCVRADFEHLTSTVNVAWKIP